MIRTDFGRPALASGQGTYGDGYDHFALDFGGARVGISENAAWEKANDCIVATPQRTGVDGGENARLNGAHRLTDCFSASPTCRVADCVNACRRYFSRPSSFGMLLLPIWCPIAHSAAASFAGRSRPTAAVARDRPSSPVPTAGAGLQAASDQ